MIEYVVNLYKSFFLSMGIESPKAMLFSTIGGIIAIVLGYIRYKWIGLVVVVLVVLFLVLNMVGFFMRIAA